MLGYMEKRKEDGEESIKNGKETINFYSPHQFEYMVVNVVNGVRDGYAALYEDGIKKIEWEFVNGKRSGMFTVYKYGLREFSGWWNEDGVWDSRYYVEYTAHANVLVHCHPTTGTIIYRGGMGKNYKIREGWGVTYDLVTGLPEQYGFFIDNKLVRVYQRFGQNQTMYEYSYDDDNVVFLLCLKSKPGGVEIDTIEINSDMRGEKIGERIVCTIETIAYDNLYTYISVSPFDTDAMNFWEHMEYIEDMRGNWTKIL